MTILFNMLLLIIINNNGVIKMTKYEVEKKYKDYIILPSYGDPEIGSKTIWLYKHKDHEDYGDSSNTLKQAKAEINWRIKNDPNYGRE